MTNQTISARKNLLRSCRHVFMLVLLLTLLVGHAYSQDTTSNPLDGYTPSGLAPGAPVGSYALSGFDTINPYSGGMSFNLPLLSIRGRGSADYTIRLPIEQKWSVNHSTADDGQGRHYDFYDAEFNAFILGTRAGYGPGALYGRQVASNYQYCDYAGSFLPTRTLTRFTFATPDGTEYELHDVQTDGNPFYVGTCAFNGTSRGKVFKTADGSAATFISDQPVVDQIFIYSGVIGGSGYLFLRDGTRYRIDGGTVTWMTDRNGNKLTFEYNNFALVSSIKDSLNREVAIEYNVNDVAPYGLCDRITYKGFDGATRIIRVSYDSLANVLRAGFSVQNSQNCFPELNNASSYSACTGGALVSAVWLPERPDHSDRRSYKFYYNNYSELARVELPTGGAFEYDWAGGYNNGPTSGAVCFDCSIYRRVTERRVYSDGVNLESQMSISKPDTLSGGAVQSNSFVETDEYDSANRLMNSVRHYYFGHAWQSMLPNDPVGYPDWHDGREYQTETLDSNGSTVLRRTTSAWDATAPTSQFGPGNNPRITETDTTLEPGGANQTSRQTFSYDQYANKTDIYEYDYTGGLLRHSHTDYLTTNGLNGIAYDTVNPNTSSPNASVTIHLRSLPVQQSIYDGGGVERARTRFEYDNYNADTNHAALQTYPRPGFSELPISGLDAAFNSSSNNLTRGNVTGTTRYLLTNDLVTGSITSYSQYDVAGNVLKAIDARGYATTVDFSDRFGVPDGEARSNAGSLDLNSAVQYGYAFPTLITNALGHTAYAQFDYYTGKPVDGEDANGIVSSGYCDDPLDRPTKVILGANQGPDVKSQNIFSYDDTNRVVTVTTDQNAFNDDHPIKSQTVYDGLGRTTEKRQYETATDYITVLQTYDALGRSYKTSNPFRASEAILWTTTSYDALSRVTSITTPDGSVVATSYSANTATVTDQAGKARKSVSDALGRLIQVYDDPSNLNYLTSYSYDALDDLTNVYQGNQNRSFVYDSLKRHTLASNPENGTVNYQYDENGNLKIKTDARGIISTYDYDALNRNQGVTYTNDSAGSPAVTRTYDGATHGIGKPWKTQTVGSTGTLTIIDSYDALGRPLVSRQQFYTGSGWGQPFTETLTYNQAGHIVTDTYPSGRIVTNSYDGAGRTISVTGSLGDGTQRTYSTGIIYSPFGTLAKEQFGTVAPIYNKLFYNVRGQLAEIREGTTYTGPTDTNSARGAIVNNYSLQAGCVGASCSATDNDGNLMRQDVYIPGSSVFSQFYGYDSLNRLQSVREDGPLGSGNWQQAYTYDQYGNRKINSAATWGNDVNNMQAAVDPNTTTNRMYAPGETDQNHSLIDYDNAGNQKKDYYSYSANGIVFDRTYDAENRIKNSAATYSSPASTQTSTYTYDGDGRRVKRNIGNTETWQVYGIGGELLAEYAPNTAPSTPQKEYGYRSGQLLISATAPAGLAMNKASDIHENAVASAPPAFGAESATAAQSVDLLASIKELILPLSGVRNVTTARTEAVSDTATPLYGPSFPYAASLNRSAFPLMPQSGSAKIAFASNRDGSAQIYSMNTDGGGLSRLTNDAANDEAPNWSPNNSRIVFQSDRDNLFSGISDIYVMNWDGSGQTRLTSDAADDSAAVWSPDGTRIVFQSARNGASYQVYVMNADGSGQANISNSAANDTQPSWSPDGSKIAFASDRDQAGFSSIYVMNANGTNQTRLTISGVGVLDNQPVWSPDGTKLTFTSTRDSIVQTWTETDDDGGTVTKSALHVNKEVYVMNANGSAQVRLTTTLENDDSASWSGDGTKIVFRSDRERDCCDPMEQVWVMNPDGTSQLDLSNNGLDDHCPSWQRVANVPPTVSLTSPANGATLIAPANIAVTASASDSDGSVSRVDFYQGVTLIGTATTSPYTVTWNNVAAGSYSLTARATDNLGATSTSAAVTITVNANVPPAVNITSPSSGAVFTAPANITVTANASDSDGTVSRVDFYQGATLIGTSMTSPYTISWNSVAAGSYALTARATDNLGATTTSAPVNITVNAPPAVSITSPTNGATFTAPSNITVTAIASDSDGSISRVDFYQGTTLLGTATTSPYTIAWNNVAAGGYTLTARATDNLGATTTSNSVNITVGSPPTVSLTTPTNGTSFTATANVTITATASASNGSINRVEFYQGSSLIGTSTASPYTISWNNVAAGSYTLKARAIDNSGVSTDSNPVSITVNAPPAVSIATPANGASFTAPVNISITANATDSDGSISHVDLYNGTTLIGTATSSPYSYVWNNVSAGTYSITAKATDNLGAQTSSTVVNITVNAPPPAVADIRWIVTDQLGTPRMIFDQTGALAGVSRHDYLPFGEELYAGGRTTNLGYGAAGDNVRQRYTGKERDIETGLDYFKARYYSSVQGRFASADAPFADQQTADPSSWNMYSYVRNSPCSRIDPDGRCSPPPGLKEGQVGICIEAFIAAKTFKMFGAGNGRGFNGNDEKLTSKFSISIIGERTRGNSKNFNITQKTTAGLTYLVEPYTGIQISPAVQGTANSKLNSGQSHSNSPALEPYNSDGSTAITIPIDRGGMARFNISTKAENGVADFIDLGSIRSSLNLSVNANTGQVRLEEGSKATGYPSFAVYSYVYNGKNIVTNTVRQIPEGRPEALTKPMKPIQQ